MPDNAPTGILHFLAQADTLIHVVFTVLLGMSLATWYLIVVKVWLHRRMRRDARVFLARFWNAPDLASVADYLAQAHGRDPFSHLAHRAFASAEQYRHRRGDRLIEAGSAEEFLTRALRRAIDEETARLDYGQTMLASIASTAPFVGLFGTVWSIYSALVRISQTGSASLEQVAGPVGEALVMTALGLAVAIPAVLAYNFFNRAKRQMAAEVDGFAHDLFAFLSTGVRGPGKEQTGEA